MSFRKNYQCDTDFSADFTRSALAPELNGIQVSTITKLVETQRCPWCGGTGVIRVGQHCGPCGGKGQLGGTS